MATIDNICKFNPNRSSDLICQNFVYETQNRQSGQIKQTKYGITLVTCGTGTLIADGLEYPLSPGTVFFCFKDDPVQIIEKDKLEYSYIDFYGRRADEYIYRLGIYSQNRVFYGYETLISFWRESLAITENGNVDMISEAVLLYTLARFTPVKKESEDVVSKIIALTNDRFSDSSLSISAIASELGYDAKYLSSLFKKKKGVAYTQYLRELRIKHAIFLMEEGVVSVKNVALLSGFGDALYFSKIFTKSEGVSPKAYILRLDEAKSRSTFPSTD